MAITSQIPHDKALHALAGVVIYAVAKPLIGAMPALGLVAAIGIAKEVLWDWLLVRGTPDVRDALWTAAGGLLALAADFDFPLN